MNIRLARNYCCNRPSLILLTMVLTFFGCEKSGDSPTQGHELAWVVSGKTFVVGAVDPLAGVAVGCGGISTTSGADGSFELRGVSEGTQMISAEKSGYEVYSRSIEVKADLKHYIYLSQKSATVSGTVANAFDGPIEGARVVLRDFIDYTDVTGRFQFNNVPRVTDTLTVTHPDYIDSKISCSIDGPEKQIDIILKRETVIESRIALDTYVDEVYPSYVWGYSTQLLLGAVGADSLGRYHFSRRHILLNFYFPEILRNDSVSLIDASLQLCSDGSYPSSTIQTYAIESSWTSAVTFNKQPSTGSVLYSGAVGDGSGARYWQVLGIDGFRLLFDRWKNRTPIYGVMVQGGLVVSRGFYSSRSTKNTPRVSFRIRY